MPGATCLISNNNKKKKGHSRQSSGIPTKFSKSTIETASNTLTFNLDQSPGKQQNDLSNMIMPNKQSDGE